MPFAPYSLLVGMKSTNTKPLNSLLSIRILLFEVSNIKRSYLLISTKFVYFLILLVTLPPAFFPFKPLPRFVKLIPNNKLKPPSIHPCIECITTGSLTTTVDGPMGPTKNRGFNVPIYRCSFSLYLKHPRKV